jgi:hypothetical protein
MGDRSHLRKCGEPSTSTDRHEVVDADTLHDEKSAGAAGLAVA